MGGHLGAFTCKRGFLFEDQVRMVCINGDAIVSLKEVVNRVQNNFYTFFPLKKKTQLLAIGNDVPPLPSCSCFSILVDGRVTLLFACSETLKWLMEWFIISRWVPRYLMSA